MSPRLKLYFDFISQPSRALYIILKQSGTKFESMPISLIKGEQATAQFKNINRFGKLPCIEDGDFKLAESVAILRYLISTNRVSQHLTGKNPEDHARLDEFLEWQHALRNECIKYFRLTWLFPLRTGKPSAEGEVQKAKVDMEKMFDVLENIWLDSSKFVSGNHATVADIFGTCEVTQIKALNYDVAKNYPKITKWMENVRQETNPDFDEAHKILAKITKSS